MKESWPEPTPTLLVHGRWSPSEDEAGVEGTLEVLSNERLLLRLNGSLPGHDLLDVMFGTDDDGTRWTLMGVKYEGHDDMGFRWRPLGAWRGIAHRQLLDVPILELCLEFPGLWFAAVHGFEPVPLEPGATIQFRRETESVHVAFNPPRPLGHMASYATWLTLAPFILCDRSIRPRTRFMKCMDGTQIEVLERKRPSRDFRPVHALWKRMPPLAEAFVRGWDLWRRAPRAAEAYMSFHEANVFQNERFLFLATTLEVYHRVFGRSGKKTPDELEAEISRITTGMGPDDANRIEGLLRTANDHSLHTRLADLTGRLVPPDAQDGFIRDFKSARNRLIHRAGIAHVDSRDVKPMQKLVNRSLALTTAVLLSHLGASHEACSAYMAENWDTAQIWAYPLPSTPATAGLHS